METTGINKTVYRSDVISALDSFTSVRNVLAWEMFQDGQVRNYDGVLNDLQRLYPDIDFDSVTENIDPESIAADEDAIYAFVDNIINKLIKSGISKDNFNYAIWACDDPENVADTYGVDKVEVLYGDQTVEMGLNASGNHCRENVLLTTCIAITRDT